jgi:hypothetical protein
MLSKPGSEKLPDEKNKFSDTSPNHIINSLPNNTYNNNNNIAAIITTGMHFFFSYTAFSAPILSSRKEILKKL